jgi:hypothetical protein
MFRKIAGQVNSFSTGPWARYRPGQLTRFLLFYLFMHWFARRL